MTFKLLIARLGIIAAASIPIAAAASQGPGTGAGTASPLTQLAMAILVYGGCALIVGGGLIGALKDARK